MTRRYALAASLVLVATTACNSPEPKTPQRSDEGVPANSASEQRLSGKEITTTTPPPPADDPTEDPTQPYVTALVPEGGDAGAGRPMKTGKVTKQECRELFDRFVDLNLQLNPQLQGVPPEMVAQLKSAALTEARNQKGDPCEKGVTRPQYNCAINSSTPDDWQRCMK